MGKKRKEELCLLNQSLKNSHLDTNKGEIMSTTTISQKILKIICYKNIVKIVDYHTKIIWVSCKKILGGFPSIAIFYEVRKYFCKIP